MRASGHPIFITVSKAALANRRALGFARPMSSDALMTSRRAMNSVFATFYHACHPIERCVRVAASYAFDECGDDVVVHLSLLVVCQRVLLYALSHKGIRDFYRVGRGRFYYELQDVEEFSGVTAGIAQQCSGLFKPYFVCFQFSIGSDSPLKQLLKVALVKALQCKQLTTREKRTNYLKGGIFGGGSNEGYDTSLYGTKERVLLRLGETVDLVYK